MVAHLLGNGANPDEQAGQLELLLQIAARICPLSVIERLLGAGADPNLLPSPVDVSYGTRTGERVVDSTTTGSGDSDTGHRDAGDGSSDRGDDDGNSNTNDGEDSSSDDDDDRFSLSLHTSHRDQERVRPSPLRWECRTPLQLAAIRETQPFPIMTRLLAAGASFPPPGEECLADIVFIFTNAPIERQDIDGHFI